MCPCKLEYGKFVGRIKEGDYWQRELSVTNRQTSRIV